MKGYFEKGAWIEQIPDLTRLITPCPCNSGYSTISISDDGSKYRVMCLGCYRESTTQSVTIGDAVARWNYELWASFRVL